MPGCTEDPVPLVGSCVGTVVFVKKDLSLLHSTAKQYLGYPCLGMVPGFESIKDKLQLKKNSRSYATGAWTVCNCKDDPSLSKVDIPDPLKVIEEVKDVAEKVVATEAAKVAAGAAAVKAGADQIAKDAAKVAAGIVDAKVKEVTALGNMVGKLVKDGAEGIGNPDVLRLPTIKLPQFAEVKLPELKLPGGVTLPEVKLPTPKDVVAGVVDLKKKEMEIVGTIAAGAVAAKLKVVDGVKVAAEDAAKAGLKVAGSVAVQKAKEVEEGLKKIDKLPGLDLGFEIPDLGQMVENMTIMMEDLADQVAEVKRRPGGG